MRLSFLLLRLRWISGLRDKVLPAHADTLIACRVALHRKMKGVMEMYLPARLLIVLGFLI